MEQNIQKTLWRASLTNPVRQKSEQVKAILKSVNLYIIFFIIISYQMFKKKEEDNSVIWGGREGTRCYVDAECSGTFL